MLDLFSMIPLKITLSGFETLTGLLVYMMPGEYPVHGNSSINTHTPDGPSGTLRYEIPPQEGRLQNRRGRFRLQRSRYLL